MSSRTNKKKNQKKRKNTYSGIKENTTRNTKNSSPIKKGSELKNKKKKNKVKKDHSILKKVILITVILLVLLVLIAGGVFVGIFFSDKFAMSAEDLLISQSNTIVYDAEGNVIAELSGKENRKIITLSEMSEYLPKAFVAIEDERFYKHKGIDIKRTSAATLTYITNSGTSNFGGSTITQQLVKNITNEKDSVGKAGMQRKIKEMSRAYQIEKMITKDQILELYLNLIPLAASGGDICGVETASMFYFNKTAKDLTIEECAFIAGVTHSPSQYNPYKENPNTTRINDRTKTVLGKMKELGYVSEQQYNEAIAKVDEGLKFQKGELPNPTIKSYFISAAIEQVIDELVETKEMSREYAKSRVYSGGLKIYTTQIGSVQQIVETEYKSDKYVLPGKTKENEGGHTQSAMVIIDHKTGRVIGCMGGLGTDVDAIGVNRIYSPRQPGSTMKPIGVYGPALVKGIITAGTVYDNTATTFGTKYSPKNAWNAKAGLCTVRDALEVSSNIVACKVMSELDPDAAIDFLRQLGITSLVKASESPEKNDSNLATALGGVTYGISTLEMAGAYATIANNGVYIEPTFYTKVEDSAGNIVLECSQETRQVMSVAQAYVMQNLLKQPVEGGSGTARALRMSNMDVGAKTGTTNDNYDLWLCGFTPYYTAATWFGYDNNEYIVSRSGAQATLIWDSVFEKLHQGLEGKRFEKPSDVVTAKICRTSGKCASSACSNTYTEYFVEGTVPGKCEGHNSITVCAETKKIATEFCTAKEEVKGLVMPEKEVNAKWKTKSGDKYNVITEKCDKHTKDTSKPKDENNSGTTVGNDSDIVVPNVVGKSEAEAKKALGKLTVKVEYKSDSSKTNGIVLLQNIKAGSVVSKEAKIILVVNKIENNKPNVEQNNNQNNTEGNKQNNTEGDKQNNTQNNTEGNKQNNTEGNKPNNTQNNTEGDKQNNTQNNTNSSNSDKPSDTTSND